MCDISSISDLELKGRLALFPQPGAVVKGSVLFLLVALGANVGSRGLDGAACGVDIVLISLRIEVSTVVR